MKTPKVFAVVLAVHLLAFSLLFVQQGCQTVSPEERADRTRPPAPSERQLDRADYQPSPVRETRTGEPVRQQWAAPARPDDAPSRDLEPLEPTDDIAADDDVLAPLDDWDDPVPFEEDDWGFDPGETRTYTVQSGDNLWNIASREGVSVNELLAVNNLTRESIIHPGQELSIPAGGEGALPGAVRVDTPRTTPAEVPEGAETYTVQRGDSLSVIAQRYGTTVRDLMAVNNLTSDTIRIDQVLILPDAASATPAEPAEQAGSVSEPDNGVRHTVVSGETPGSIANRYGITVAELMDANNISDPRRMRVGQVLVIPGAEEESAEESAEEPAPPSQPSDSALPVVPLEQDDMTFIEDEDDEDEDDIPFVPIIPDDE